MAMTKAEKAEMEKIRHDLALALALRFCGLPEPELMPKPVYGGGMVEGWDMNPHGSGRVEICTTSAHSHWLGRGLDGVVQDEEISTHGRVWAYGSSGAISLYRSPADALLALRLAKEREFAQTLARIDRQIAEAKLMEI